MDSITSLLEDSSTEILPRVSRQLTLKYDGVLPEALIFEGGGTKGIVYAGAVKCLEHFDMLGKVTKLAGTSAGAQTAALVAFGYTGDELESVLRTAPWNRLLDYSRGPCGVCFNVSRLFSDFGVCPGDELLNFLDDLFFRKCGRRNMTFQELYDWNGKELRVGVSNLVTKRFEFLDRHRSPRMPVCLAARASSSIPIVFKPVRWHKALFVDGALEGNLPTNAFAGCARSLAFHLQSSEEYDGESHSMPDNFTSYMGVAMGMLYNAAQRHGVDSSSYSAQQERQGGTDIVRINTGNAGLLDMQMSRETWEGLIESGYGAVLRYLSPDTRPTSVNDMDRNMTTVFKEDTPKHTKTT